MFGIKPYKIYKIKINITVLQQEDNMQYYKVLFSVKINTASKL